MRTPIDEQETIIRWYRDEKEASIYTSDYKFVKSETCEGDIVSKTYKAPKTLLYGRKAKNKTAPLTDEQKEALAMRFKR